MAKPIAERFPFLARTYRTIRDNMTTFQEPKMTPMGFKFTGTSKMEEGIYEVDEVEIVKRHLKDVDIFINIGANSGYYCCIALAFGKETIAFEPIDLNLRYLYRNIKANNWDDKIEIFPLALSNKTGLIEIYGAGTGASLIEGWAEISKNYSRLVPVSTLDSVLCNRLAGQKCFFLVDIEGSEKYMLEGAKAHLNFLPKPIWMVEISITEHQPQGTKINPNLLSTFKIFWENGYEVWTADKNSYHIKEEDILEIYEKGDNIFETHNFLFIEKK